MIFKDDIDGRELQIEIEIHKGRKYIAIQGEGYFLLGTAESITRNMIQQVEELRKVHCKECKYRYKGTIYKCIHPDNIIEDDNFDKSYMEKSYKWTPEETNAKNDCVWFVEKDKK